MLKLARPTLKRVTLAADMGVEAVSVYDIEGLRPPRRSDAQERLSSH